MNPNSKQFFGGLESLRGIAALVVVLYHAEWMIPSYRSLFVRNGYLMVDLFFVLSGFVICHNYGRKINTAKDIVQFMLLRLGRLYPLHLFFLMIFLGIEIAKYMAESRFGFVPHVTHAFSLNNLPSFLASLMLLQSFFPSTNLSFDAPSWSISVEFYTYLVFAAVAVIFPGKRKMTLVSCLLISLVVFLLGFWPAEGLHMNRPGVSFLRCILGFFTGTFAYQAYGQYQPYIARWSRVLIPCLGIVLLCFLSLNSNPALDFSALPLFAFLIVAIAAAPENHIGWDNILNSAPLRWLGKVSYSIYMSHMAILMAMDRLCAFAQKHSSAEAHDWLCLVFAIPTMALVLIVSQLTYKWIERPGQKMFRGLAAKWFKA
jgi:peptidoglycan/LPS O-acetylase OafA/YrhL